MDEWPSKSSKHPPKIKVCFVIFHVNFEGNYEYFQYKRAIGIKIIILAGNLNTFIKFIF